MKDPIKKAIQICDIVYHSSMGDTWNPFVRNRANKIVDEILDNTSGANIEYWNRVKQEINKLYY